jgi:DUF2946 family protein
VSAAPTAAGVRGSGVMTRGGGRIRFAAWFGALALAVQLYLPIHLVHRVASRSDGMPATPAHHQHSTTHAVQAHHEGVPDGRPNTGREHCPICSMLHSASPMALADGVELPRPNFHGTALPPRPPSYAPAAAFGASYASRAPPSSLG